MYLFHAPVLHSTTHLRGIPVGIVDTRIVTLVQPLCMYMYVSMYVCEYVCIKCGGWGVGGGGWRGYNHVDIHL